MLPVSRNIALHSIELSDLLSIIFDFASYLAGGAISIFFHSCLSEIRVVIYGYSRFHYGFSVTYFFRKENEGIFIYEQRMK